VRRTACTALLILAASVPLHQGMASVPDPTWKSVPRELRPLLHLQARDIGPLPGERTELVDPNRWPTVTVIGGEVCSLRVSRGVSDWIGAAASLKDVAPGEHFGLWYDGPPWSGWATRKSQRGLEYGWWPGGSILASRIWRNPDRSKHEQIQIANYPDGKVFLRSVSKRDPGSTSGPFETHSEYFGTNGKLVGFAYLRGDSSKANEMYFWSGHRVKADQFGSKTADLIARYFPNNKGG
jgi:hypothetical protein